MASRSRRKGACCRPDLCQEEPEHEDVTTSSEGHNIWTDGGDTYKTLFVKLENWTREHLPFVEEPEYTWTR